MSGLSRKVIEDRNALILSQIEAHAPNNEKYVLIAKIVNNLQVTIKNIHIRYEDKLSVADVRISAHLSWSWTLI